MVVTLASQQTFDSHFFRCYDRWNLNKEAENPFMACNKDYQVDWYHPPEVLRVNVIIGLSGTIRLMYTLQ